MASQIDELTKLDRTAIRKYLAWLIDLGYVRASVARKLSTLRTFLGWLVTTKVIEGNPLPARRVMKTDKKLPRFLSESEALRLVQAPQTYSPLGMRDRSLLELIYATGMRVSELVDLKLNDIDLNSQRIRCMGKGSKERIVMIGSEAKEVLCNYLSIKRKEGNFENMQYLFPALRSGANKKKGAISQRTVFNIVKKYVSPI